MTRGPNRADDGPRPSFVMPLTCSPARLPADTRSKHLVDRLQPTGASQWLFFAVVGAFVIAAPLLPTRPGLAAGALASLAGSAWCLANFWRCREAHCIVTGAGWAGLFFLQIIELAIGRSLVHGAESSLFVAVLVIGVVFECGWQGAFGTNAVRRDAPGARGWR